MAPTREAISFCLFWVPLSRWVCYAVTPCAIDRKVGRFGRSCGWLCSNFRRQNFFSQKQDGRLERSRSISIVKTARSVVAGPRAGREARSAVIFYVPPCRAHLSLCCARREPRHSLSPGNPVCTSRARVNEQGFAFVSQEVVENDLQTDPENHLHPAPPQYPYYHTLPPTVTNSLPISLYSHTLCSGTSCHLDP